MEDTHVCVSGLLTVILKVAKRSCNCLHSMTVSETKRQFKNANAAYVNSHGDAAYPPTKKTDC